tara:strand:+ start:324 stop:539 length:216 start_codon:yes stop_codon:yes gene_type:complete
MSEINDEIIEHIYYERGKEELNCKNKDMQLWQNGYDQGFSDAQEILSKKFEKMILELSNREQVKSDLKKKS